jgi:spoIIIJ-associated protein
VEWVEVRGKTVEIAVEAALKELEIDDRSRVEIEVLQEPERGFLGIGSQDAVVRVKPQPAKKRRRRRGRGKGSSEGGGAKGSRSSGGSRDRGGRDGESRNDGGRRGGDGGSRRGGGSSGRGSDGGRRDSGKKRERKEAVDVDLTEQEPVVQSFLEGLVGAFGLEGAVETRIDDEVIVADVKGPQTEAMVGARGTVIEAIHELTKTVLQRQTSSSARVRLDIAGYAERRRQALSIYAEQLIDQVLEEGGEIMLEPMSAGDRKVIHDAVAARDGVRSYSEGEAPQRYVVIATGGSDEEE